MTERDKQDNFGDEPQEIEVIIQDSWTDIFTDINRLSKLNGIDVTRMAPLVQFNLEEEDIQRSLVINSSAVTEDGRPRIIVINTDVESTPSQQVVLEAEWKDDDPIITVNDFTTRPNAKNTLSHKLIGNIASETLTRYIEAKENNEQKPTAKSFAPDDYASGIN